MADQGHSAGSAAVVRDEERLAAERPQWKYCALCWRCETYYDPTLVSAGCPHDEMAPAFLTAAAPRECKFCKGPSEARCGWIVERPFVAFYRELEPGDRVRRYRESPGAALRPPAVVLEVAPSPCAAGSFPVRVTIRTQGREKTFNVSGYSYVRKMRNVQCAAPVCEHCMREVGEKKVYCRDHWDAWEAAS